MYAQQTRKAKSRQQISSVPPRKKKNNLELMLLSVLQKSHDGEKDFFPKGVISTIITEKCVRKELTWHLEDTHDAAEMASFAKAICEETEFQDKSGKMRVKCFRKIFVILVLINKTPAIVKFLKKDVSDADLPLKKVERLNEKGVYDLRLSRDPTKLLKCFSKKWGQLCIWNFEQYQWKTLSPFFGKGGYKDVKHYLLQDQVILPFIAVDRGEGGRVHRAPEFNGGYGKVIEVDLHHEHHNFEALNPKVRWPPLSTLRPN
jgi:hypothetical protein